MSARQLRALAALYEPAADDFERGKVAGLSEAAEIVDALAAQLDGMARESDHLGTQAAFRRAARLVARGDEP